MATAESVGERGRVLIIVQNLPVPFDRRFWLEAMQFEEVGDATVQCGDSLLFLEQDASVQPASDDRRGRGLRYITVQIYKCEEEHAGILERGGSEGRPPIVLGDTVRYSFVRDPDGNWIEVSQRGSLTGSID